jgi:hypothetical protein
LPKPTNLLEVDFIVQVKDHKINSQKLADSTSVARYESIKPDEITTVNLNQNALLIERYFMVIFKY